MSKGATEIKPPNRVNPTMPVKALRAFHKSNNVHGSGNVTGEIGVFRCHALVVCHPIQPSAVPDHDRAHSSARATGLPDRARGRRGDPWRPRGAGGEAGDGGDVADQHLTNSDA